MHVPLKHHNQKKKTYGLVKSCSAAQVPKMPESDGYKKTQNWVWVGYIIWTWNSKQPFFLMDVWWNKQCLDVKIRNHPTETSLKQWLFRVPGNRICCMSPPNITTRLVNSHVQSLPGDEDSKYPQGHEHRKPRKKFNYQVIQAVTFSSPSWRSLNHLKGSRFHHHKKVTSRIARYQPLTFLT